MALAAPSLSHAAALGSVQVTAQGRVEQIAISLSQQVAHKKVFFLSNPERLVMDLPKLAASGPVALPAGYRGQLVQAVRFGQFDAQTSRLVIDLTKPVEVSNLFLSKAQTGEGWQIVVEITPAAGGSSSLSPAVKQQMGKPATTSSAPLTKPLIVIDAGHGGKDPGAIGRSGIKEKIITLQYAKALRGAIERTGRYRVALTRADDRFILLGDRVNIARRAKADLFISLHADSNPNQQAQGFSVYTVSEQASDAEAAALAERENKADLLAGFDVDVQDEQVASILLDLAQRETKNKSSALADRIVESLPTKIPKLPNTHRYAGFRVLKAPDIPSVLIELGFLTNRFDEERLQTREYQELMVAGVVAGVDRYFAEQKR